MATRQLALLMAIAMVMPFVARPAWAVVGTVTVKVTDQKGQPVPGAKISLTPQDPSLPTKEAETDREGSVIIPLVEGGRYRLEVTRDQITTTRDVTVHGGETTPIDVTLAPTPLPPPPVEKVSPPVETPPSRFRVELQGEAIWQGRELDGSFPIARSRENVTSDPDPTSFRILEHVNSTKVTSLNERGRLALGWAKFYYRAAQWLTLHLGVGTGQLRTKLDDLSGKQQFFTQDNLFEETESFTRHFEDPATRRGSSNQGWAFQAGGEAVLFRTPNPHFSVVLSGRWAYFEGDDILTIAQGVEIDESHTHLLDIGINGRLQRERFGMHAGIKTIWLWTEYEGHFENIESFRVFGTPAPFLTRIKKERFSFDVEPRAFPILGVLGIDYAFTDSFGMKLEGAAGNSHTYSVMGGLFYRF
jgi:hypothetical protein